MGDDFNKRLSVFNVQVTELEGWLAEGRKRIDAIISPTADLSPEDRVTKTMEVQEDLRKNQNIRKNKRLKEKTYFQKVMKKCHQMLKSSMQDWKLSEKLWIPWTKKSRKNARNSRRM